MDGKINLIVIKSILKFVRSTEYSFTTVRKLKEKGVENFQKENIYTLGYYDRENGSVSSMTR